MNPSKRFFSTFILLSLAAILLFICSRFPLLSFLEDDAQTEEEYTTLSLFSNVTFWKFPAWSQKDGTITADVSKRTGVALDVTIPPQEANRKLSLLLLQDGLPDLLALSDAAVIRQLIDSDSVWRLDELLEQYCPDSHLLTEFPKDIRSELTRQYGGWYAYPSNMNSDDARAIWPDRTGYYSYLVRYRQNHGILFNRALLAQAGLTENDIQTESQALAAFEKIKQMRLLADGAEIIPLLLDGNSYQSTSLDCLLNSFGAEIVDENGDYKTRWLQPECKEAFKFINTAFRRQYAYTEHLSYDNLQIRALMGTGRVFCFIGNIANTDIVASDWLSMGPLLPDSGKRPVLGMDLTAPTGWLQTFVSKSCAHPEEAARFLNYMTSSEGLLYTNYGEEGVDFYYNRDGLIQSTDIGVKKRVNSDNALSKFWNFYNSAWDNSVTPLPEPDSEASLFAKLQCAFAVAPETAIYNSSLLRLPDSYIAPDDAYGQANAAIEEYCKIQIPAILTTASDQAFEEEYLRFIHRLTELNVDGLNQKINWQMHQNFKEYGETITRVNEP